jgi:23S rRNA (guanosine2251-2'-O)-methyltransferase
MQPIVLIAHNLRSCHNVGSLLRTAEGLGVSHVLLTGYSPYPVMDNDERLPHLARKIDAQIHKTALGAERLVTWKHYDNINTTITALKDEGYVITALEQSPSSTPLPAFHTKAPIALLVGREVDGVEPEVLTLCDQIIEIPMFGHKESFNVASAAAMALYHLRFAPTAQPVL